MSNHSDLSAVHNTLKALEKKLDRNAKVLGWVLLLTGVGIAVTVFTFLLKA